MRREQQPLCIASATADFRFNFQMTDGGVRHACSVIIQAPTRDEAASLVRENWPTIEKLARERLATAASSKVQVQLGLPAQ